MRKRHSEAEINRLMREAWLQTKARGKNRFVLREMLWSLPIWFGVVFGVPALEALANHTPFSVRLMLSEYWTVFLIVLAIFLLGGYLTGRWKWTDFEKKYPENSLSPWN
jgi:hypothetical protein